jgi:ABC-type glutathione transport system ATPase component
VNRPLLSLRDVHKTFGYGDSATIAANGIDLDIQPGEILGLVGESGSGKSTIANIVLGLVTPDSGDVEFDGTPVSVMLDRQSRSYRRQVQAVFQQPLLALDQRRTIGWSVAEPLVIHRVGNVQARTERAAELLGSVGLSADFMTRLPRELSGGQLQRVNIARALALEPRLLVCDEAVSALDVSVQAQVLDIFLEMQERLGIAMLFISHNIAVVRHISDLIIVMRHGDVVERGETSQVCENPRSDYAKELIGSWLEPVVR